MGLRDQDPVSSDWDRLQQVWVDQDQNLGDQNLSVVQTWFCPAVGAGPEPVQLVSLDRPEPVQLVSLGPPEPVQLVSLGRPEPVQLVSLGPPEPVSAASQNSEQQQDFLRNRTKDP